MTLDEMIAQFEAPENEDIYFVDIKNRKTERADLHAFNLIDSLVPSACNILAVAEHDQVWLFVDPSYLADKISPEQVRELVACGLWYDEETQSMSMYI